MEQSWSIEMLYDPCFMIHKDEYKNTQTKN